MAEVAENVVETFEEPAAPLEAEVAETILETNVVATTELPEIKLFGRWSCDDVTVNDISLQDYISVKEKFARYLPHSAGRYAAKRFRKAQCPIVERLTCSLMMKGRNNGKKLMACRIVKHSFEIIHLLTGENPLQVHTPHIHIDILPQRASHAKLWPEIIATRPWVEWAIARSLRSPGCRNATVRVSAEM